MTSIIKVDNIQNSAGTSALSINSSGLLMPKNVMMQVKSLNTDQSVSANTTTKVEWGTVEVDTCSGWDATNHRYTPTVSGWYLYGGVIRCILSTVGFIEMMVRKNGGNDGDTTQRSQIQGTPDFLTNGEYALPTAMFYLNGTTDYIDVTFQCDEATTLHDHTARPSRFWAMLVHNS